MSHPITRDHARFKKIVKGRIRNNLKKYILNGELPTPKSGGKYKIPIPSIDIPRFRFMDKKQGGVGQGDGRPGDPIEEKNAKKGKGEGGQQAGEEEGGKDLEVEVTLEELASFLGDELELPNIEPKGRKTLIRETDQYKSIRTVGPDSLKHFKRSYREALKRQIISGTYDHDNPNIIPIKGDMRYRSSTQVIEHESAAVVIYMMDVSGSMGDGQKEIVRTESFWLNLWLKSQYKNIEIRYIIHDATAKEVDEETFFQNQGVGRNLD